MFSKPSSKLDNARIPTEWWLRPVSRQARVGEHRAVVWKFVYRRPPAASRSKFGVSMTEPKQLRWANPVSSSRMTSTFGESADGRTGDGHAGVDSLVVRRTIGRVVTVMPVIIAPAAADDNLSGCPVRLCAICRARPKDSHPKDEQPPPWPTGSQLCRPACAALRKQ